MNVRTFVAVAACIVAVIGVVLLSTTVSATTSSGTTVACGTGWKTDTTKAAYDKDVTNLTNAMLGYGRYGSSSSNDYLQKCGDALSARRAWGFLLGGAALLTLLGAVVVRSVSDVKPSI